jgi:2-methylcitrate dehydratase PrpD
MTAAARFAEHALTTRFEDLSPRDLAWPPAPGSAPSVPLQHGEITISQFTDTARADPRTLALAACVRVVDDGNPDPNALAPQTVSVRLAGGTTLTWRCETMLAHPSRPLSSEQCLTKFSRCLEFSAAALRTDAAARLIEQIAMLETVEDVRVLAGLAAGSPV